MSMICGNSLTPSFTEKNDQNNDGSFLNSMGVDTIEIE